MSISFILLFVSPSGYWPNSQSSYDHKNHTSFPAIAFISNESAPKAKSRSNTAFRFQRMTGKLTDAGMRPSPGV
jgi:hypothetical protein